MLIVQNTGAISGFHTALGKVKAIINSPVATNIKEPQSYLGLLTFYQVSIELVSNAAIIVLAAEDWRYGSGVCSGKKHFRHMGAY